MTKKNYDLGHKGYWFEQNAELAEKCNQQEIVQSGYRKAMDFYEQGGFIDQALRIARKIGDSKKAKELESRLEK